MMDGELPEISLGVKRWLEKNNPSTVPVYDLVEPDPVDSAAAVPEPSVSVPVSSTNLVISQIFTETLTAAQTIGGIAIGAILASPGAISSITGGWPAWAGAVVIALAAWVKKTYFDASNAATVGTVSSLQKVKS